MSLQTSFQETYLNNFCVEDYKMFEVIYMKFSSNSHPPSYFLSFWTEYCVIRFVCRLCWCQHLSVQARCLGRSSSQLKGQCELFKA